MKKLVYMEQGWGWETPRGVHFSKEHPFQLVEEEEIPFLLSAGRFREATPDDLMQYYKVTKEQLFDGYDNASKDA